MYSGVWHPLTDVYHYDGKCFVKVELAGIQPAEMRISARDRQLYVSGARRDSVVQKHLYYHSLEICYSTFERVIALPFDIEPESIRWDYRDGMLLIQMNRADTGGES